MKIFALSDPHLAFATPDKKMDTFGEYWINHPVKIKQNWERFVGEDDLVLIPGDISWAKRIEGALADLHWLDQLPGRKIILKGNHDFWWNKTKVLMERLPKIHSGISGVRCRGMGLYVYGMGGR